MCFTADCFIPPPCGIISLIPEKSYGRNRPDQSLVSCHKHTRSPPALSRFGQSACMFMITLSTDFCNPISQDFYDDLLSSIQFHRLSCSCGLSGCLKIHGYYTRGDQVWSPSPYPAHLPGQMLHLRTDTCPAPFLSYPLFTGLTAGSGWDHHRYGKRTDSLGHHGTDPFH